MRHVMHVQGVPVAVIAAWRPVIHQCRRVVSSDICGGFQCRESLIRWQQVAVSIQTETSAIRLECRRNTFSVAGPICRCAHLPATKLCLSVRGAALLSLIGGQSSQLPGKWRAWLADYCMPIN